MRVHILLTFGSRRIASIRTSEVQAWIAGLSAGQVDTDGTVTGRPLAPSTVSVVHGKVAAIFRAAVEEGADLVVGRHRDATG